MRPATTCTSNGARSEPPRAKGRLAISIGATLVGCDPAPDAVPVAARVTPPVVPAAGATSDAARPAARSDDLSTPGVGVGGARIDPAVVPARDAAILSRRDTMLGAPGRQRPGCLVTVRFLGLPDDEVATPGACRAIDARLMSKAEVQALGQMGDVDRFALSDMDQPVNARMLYIEAGATAQLSFVNGGGIVQTITLAD